jgi:S-adenosylmethionine hydrolase
LRRAYYSAVRIITLTTDFGAADWFVGTMKGVILGIQPRARLVDITHEIPVGDIRAGAFALAASCKFFPRQTVHVAVVDPGVGSRRRAIAVQTLNYLFVGPDNGILSLALAREKIKAVHQVTNEQLFLRPVSNTFHGRDVFAPVAANLSKGLPLASVGPSMKEFVKLSWPEPQRTANSIKGEIAYIDRFGNVITNIGNAMFASLAKGSGEITVKSKRFCALRPFYQAVPSGNPVAVPGSSGFVELAVNGGSAAKKFNLRVGQAAIVRVRPH